MKKKIFLLVTSFGILISCSYNGSFHGLYGYAETTINENPNTFIHDKDVCNIENKRDIAKVYITNGLNLKNCIKDFETSVVYIWKPKCSSKICIPLEIIANKCKERNLKLFIVAEYYDSEKMNKTYNMDTPIYAIDTKYYKSNLTTKYLSCFQSDLMNNTSLDSNGFFLFKNGKFVDSYSSYELLEYMYLKDKKATY